jgi:hypothetical protein
MGSGDAKVAMSSNSISRRVSFGTLRQDDFVPEHLPACAWRRRRFSGRRQRDTGNVSTESKLTPDQPAPTEGS